MTEPAFGPIFLSLDFDDHVTALVRSWIDTYLSEVELRLELDRRSTDRPKSYNRAIDPEHWPEEALPGILVVSTGFLDEPTRIGDGLYAGWWDWAVVALLSGRDYESTRKKTGIYQAALRALLMQHSDLDGQVADTVWLSEPMDFAPFEGRDRTKGVAAFEFRSYIEGVVHANRAPAAPDAPEALDDPSTPHTPDPTIESADVDLHSLADDD